MPSRPAHVESASARWTFAISLAGISLALVITVGASWRDNVLAPVTAQGSRFDLQVLAPQGWAFFTRSPRAPSVVPYRQARGQWVRADSLPQARAENLFGLSRNQRAQGTELGVISSKVRAYTTCEGYLRECLARPRSSILRVVNDTNTHHFCGGIRLVKQEPVKFAYRGITPESVRANSYADVEVTCSGT